MKLSNESNNNNMKTGIELIALERKEQIEKHGRTVDKDVKINTSHQLSYAASKLCSLDTDMMDTEGTCPDDWSLLQWGRLLELPYKERLIIAGSLIAAEIDRLHAVDHSTSVLP